VLTEHWLPASAKALAYDWLIPTAGCSTIELPGVFKIFFVILNIFMLFSKILCRLGFHKWSKEKIYFHFESNVKEYEKYCLNCGKVKRRIVTV